MQGAYDEEFNKLSESLKSAALQASEMERIHEQLAEEKNGLERRLEESEYEFSATITHIKNELNEAVSQLSDLEELKNHITEDRNKLKSEVEAAIDKVKLEQETNMKLLLKVENQERELEEIDSLKEQINEKSENIVHLEKEIVVLKEKVKEFKEMNDEILIKHKHHQEMKDSLTAELTEKEKCIIEIKNQLMAELRSKAECITDLKKKMVELEDQLQESELKVEVNENQLKSFIQSIGYTPQGAEENIMESFTNIRQQVCEQKEKFSKITGQRDELSKELQRKNEDIQEYQNTINDLRTELARAQEFVKSLSEKEYELENAIAILQNELQLSKENESTLTRKLFERTEEVQILLTNLEKRKLEISQLEEIILTLEEQSCKLRASRRAQEDQIIALENKLECYKKKLKSGVPTEYIDNFISILEAELNDLDREEILTGDCKSCNFFKTKKSNLECLSPFLREKRYCGDSDVNNFNRCVEDFKISKGSSFVGAEPPGVRECNYLSDDSVTSHNHEIKQCFRDGVGAKSWVGRSRNTAYDVEPQPPHSPHSPARSLNPHSPGRSAHSPVRSVTATAATAVSATSTESNRAGKMRMRSRSPRSERQFQHGNSKLTSSTFIDV